MKTNSHVHQFADDEPIPMSPHSIEFDLIVEDSDLNEHTGGRSPQYGHFKSDVQPLFEMSTGHPNERASQSTENDPSEIEHTYPTPTSSKASSTTDGTGEHLAVGKHDFEHMNGALQEMRILEEKGTSMAGVYVAEIPLSDPSSEKVGSCGERLILKVFDIRYAHGLQYHYGYTHTPKLAEAFDKLARTEEFQDYLDSLSGIVDSNCIPPEIFNAIRSRPVRQVDILDFALCRDEYDEFSDEPFQLCLEAGLVAEDVGSEYSRNVFATTMLHFSFLWELACLQYVDERTKDTNKVLPRPKYVLRQAHSTSDIWSFPFDTLAIELLQGSTVADALARTRSSQNSQQTKHLIVRGDTEVQDLMLSAFSLANVIPQLGLEHDDLAQNNLWIETEGVDTFKTIRYIDAGALRLIPHDTVSRDSLLARIKSFINHDQFTRSSRACPSVDAFGPLIAPCDLDGSLERERRLFDMIESLCVSIAPGARLQIAKRFYTQRWRTFRSALTTLQWWTVTNAISKAMPYRKSSILLSYLQLVRTIMDVEIQRLGVKTSEWFISSVQRIHGLHILLQLPPADTSEDYICCLVDMCEQLASSVDLKDKDTVLAAASQVIFTNQLFVELNSIPAHVDDGIIAAAGGHIMSSSPDVYPFLIRDPSWRPFTQRVDKSIDTQLPVYELPDTFTF